MSIEVAQKRTFPLLLLHLLFLVLPTVALMYVFIGFFNESRSLITAGSFWQKASFGLGMTASYILYYYRARFLITYPILLIVLWIIYEGLKLIPGEFDMFFVVVRYKLFAVTLAFAVLIGFLLARWKRFPIVFAVVLLAITIVIRADNTDYFTTVDAFQLLMYRMIMPVLLYLLYMVFMAESLRDLLELKARRIFGMLGRLALFLILISAGFYATGEYLRPSLRLVQEKFGGAKGDSAGGGVDTNGMLKKNPNDGKHSMRDYAQMKNNQGSGGKKLLFCAYLPNFIGPDSFPNPIYFTSYHLTYYDTAHERFERDSLVPMDDVFDPKPNRIPLFKTLTDTSVIRKGMGNKLRRSVTCDIYYKEMSTEDFTSPSTAYSCQPITVEEEFRKEFPFAMKTKSWISELNSAYFVYNTDNKDIRKFQEQRFEVLREVKNYNRFDKKLLDYYTTNPKGPLFDSIADLAKEIAKDAKTPIDKIIAVRDYFLSKDEFGEPNFVYSLNVGKKDDPNIANARMLRTFLFKEKRGYCTYYAGASLFMLRALGVPTRFTVGFLTEDRADKNKGWYWFYSNQGHAWIQVYFPEYGWLDFDMTVSNTDSRESPAPDGTPPLQPPKAWLMAEGVAAADADTVKKSLQVKFKKGIFYDRDFNLENEQQFEFDVVNAKVSDEKGPRKLKEIHAGDSVMIISYADGSKNVPRPVREMSAEAQVMRAIQPVIGDEVRIKAIPEKKKPEKEQQKKITDTFSWWTLLWGIGGFAVLLVFIFFLFPTLCYLWYKRKAAHAKTPKDRAYWVYRFSMFTYNQLGLVRDENETALEYARDKVDKNYASGFEDFMRIYLKIKYTNMPPDTQELEAISRYSPAFTAKAFARYPLHKRIAKFLNTALTNRFLKRPADEKKTV